MNKYVRVRLYMEWMCQEGGGFVCCCLLLFVVVVVLHPSNIYGHIRTGTDL